MSSSPTPPPASNASAGGPKKMPTDRLVLLIVLAVMLVALAWDYLARWQATKAYDELAKYVDGHEKADPALSKTPLTREQVVTKVGREPSGKPTVNGPETIEAFSWRGVREYKVYVQFIREADSAEIERQHALERAAAGDTEEEEGDPAADAAAKADGSAAKADGGASEKGSSEPGKGAAAKGGDEKTADGKSDAGKGTEATTGDAAPAAVDPANEPQPNVKTRIVMRNVYLNDLPGEGAQEE